MYCVKGYDSIGDSSTSSADSGLRRHAMGLRDPLRKAFSETFASVDWLMPCSSMYRLIFMPKNWVVRARPEAPYQSPRPELFVFTRKAPRSCLSKPMAMP